MSFELIETVEVGAGGASSIEFTSIPQDGTDLVVKMSLREDGTVTDVVVYLNNDTGANYPSIQLFGNGTDVFAGTINSTGLRPKGMGNQNDTANTFGNTSLYLSNYTSTSVKSISVDGVDENNGSSALQQLLAGSYTGTSPITTITVSSLFNNLVANSTASLYKITAA